MNLATEKNNENVFALLWSYVHLLRKYLHYLVIFCVIGIVVGTVLAFMKTPMYRSTAIVKFDYDTRDVLNSGENFGGSTYMMKADLFNTEYRIIQSTAVAEEVVERLGLPFFENSIKKPKTSTSLFQIVSEYFSPKKPSVMTEEERKEALKKSLSKTLAAQVKVEGVRRTNLVEISFVSADRHAAEKITNAFVDSYIEYGLETLYEKNAQAHAFLNKQSKELQEKIDKISVQIAEFSRDKNVVLVGMKDETVEDANMVKLTASLFDAQTRLLENQSNLQKISTTPASELREITQDPVYQDLSSKLIGLKGQYARDLKIYKDQMPRMQSLQKEIETLENSLKTQTENIYKRLLSSARASVQASNNEIASLQRSISTLQGKAVQTRMTDKTQIDTLKLEIEGLRNQLSIVNSKREELELAMSLKEVGRTNKTVIQKGDVPNAPISPNVKRYAMLCGVLALFLAMGVIFVK